MTLSQIWVYRSQTPDAGRQVSLNAAEAIAYRRAKRVEKQAWVQNVLQELRHGV